MKINREFVHFHLQFTYNIKRKRKERKEKKKKKRRNDMYLPKNFFFFTLIQIDTSHFPRVKGGSEIVVNINLKFINGYSD